MMTLVQMPESLADDLCDGNGWKVVLATRSGAVEVALEVIAAGSNLVSLVGAPESIQGSLDTIRSWFRRNSNVTTIEGTRAIIRWRKFLFAMKQISNLRWPSSKLRLHEQVQSEPRSARAIERAVAHGCEESD